MLERKVNFERICDTIPKWKWSELKIGFERGIISNSEIISYANQVLSEEIEQFDSVLELAIAEEDEVEEIILNLAFREEEESLEMINAKWIFSIIYDAYIHLNNEIYDVIDDVYTEFEYPEEISHLIGYMPCEDGISIDEKLNQYIKMNKNIW